MARQKNGQKIILTLILISMAFGVFGCGHGEYVLEDTDKNIEKIQQREDKVKEQKLAIWAKILKERDRSFKFYGKVVDQFNDPVPGATVVMKGSYFKLTADLYSGTKTIEVKTDAKGAFSFTSKGSTLLLDNIIKPGYEFMPQANPKTSFDVAGIYPPIIGEKKEPFISDVSAPYIFKLRQRGQAEYLYNHRFIARFFPDKEMQFRLKLLGSWIDEWGFDHKRPTSKMSLHKEVLRYRRRGIEIPPRLKAYEQKPEEEGDVEVTGKFSGGEKKYEVRFTFLGTDGGVLLKDELVYEAPTDGYKSEVVLTIPFNKDIKDEECLCIKGEGGETYSRLTIRVFSCTEKMLSLEMALFTNPAGSRHLEYHYKVIEAEKKRRKERGERFRKIRNDAVEKYRAETKAKKERRNKDTEARIREDVKESFKEMIRQEMLKEKQTNENNENG